MKEIIKIIAKENGVSVMDVEEDMRNAIVYAMSSHNDNEGKKLWSQLSPHGEEPSIEEFILFVAQKAMEKNFI